MNAFWKYKFSRKFVKNYFVSFQSFLYTIPNCFFASNLTHQDKLVSFQSFPFHFQFDVAANHARIKRFIIPRQWVFGLLLRITSTCRSRSVCLVMWLQFVSNHHGATFKNSVEFIAKFSYNFHPKSLMDCYCNVPESSIVFRVFTFITCSRTHSFMNSKHSFFNSSALFSMLNFKVSKTFSTLRFSKK